MVPLADLGLASLSSYLLPTSHNDEEGEGGEERGRKEGSGGGEKKRSLNNRIFSFLSSSTSSSSSTTSHMHANSQNEGMQGVEERDRYERALRLVLDELHASHLHSSLREKEKKREGRDAIGHTPSSHPSPSPMPSSPSSAYRSTSLSSPSLTSPSPSPFTLPSPISTVWGVEEVGGQLISREERGEVRPVVDYLLRFPSSPPPFLPLPTSRMEAPASTSSAERGGGGRKRGGRRSGEEGEGEGEEERGKGKQEGIEAVMRGRQARRSDAMASMRDESPSSLYLHHDGSRVERGGDERGSREETRQSRGRGEEGEDKGGMEVWMDNVGKAARLAYAMHSHNYSIPASFRPDLYQHLLIATLASNLISLHKNGHKWGEGRQKSSHTITSLLYLLRVTTGQAEYQLEDVNAIAWQVHAKLQTLYSQLSSPSSKMEVDDKVIKQIEADVPRCKAANLFLSSTHARLRLKQILRAWAVTANALSMQYWQGIDSIAASFLLLFPTSDASAFAATLLFTALFAADIFGREEVNAACLDDRLRVCRTTLMYADPQLVKKMDEVGCDGRMFGVSWIFTYFAHTLPVDELYQIWDAMLMRGRGSFFSCLYSAVLTSHRRRLFQSSSFEETIRDIARMESSKASQILSFAVGIEVGTPISIRLVETRMINDVFPRCDHIPDCPFVYPSEVLMRMEKYRAYVSTDVVTLKRSGGRDERGGSGSERKAMIIPAPILVDIRTKDAHQYATVDGAHSIPFPFDEKKLKSLLRTAQKIEEGVVKEEVRNKQGVISKIWSLTTGKERKIELPTGTKLIPEIVVLGDNPYSIESAVKAMQTAVEDEGIGVYASLGGPSAYPLEHLQGAAIQKMRIE